MFDQLVVSSAIATRTNKPWAVALSALGQSLLLSFLILVPLIYTEALPTALLKTLLVAPPQPPAAPQVLRTHSAARLRVIPLSHIVAPPSIPSRITAEANEPPAIYIEGGAAGTTENSELSDVIRPATPLRPPAAPEQKPQRIRVGGSVEAASIVIRVMPEYPAIARAAHISGTIVLHAIIANDGTVQELVYVSGPPLLLKAAMEAVRQWRYRPTMLNGEPVEVETTIDVVFNLGG